MTIARLRADTRPYGVTDGGSPADSCPLRPLWCGIPGGGSCGAFLALSPCHLVLN